MSAVRVGDHVPVLVASDEVHRNLDHAVGARSPRSAQRTAEHLLERRVATVSLCDLAAAVGVSARMLVHHFGAREQLLTSALREARSRQGEDFEARLASQDGRRYADVLADA